MGGRKQIPLEVVDELREVLDRVDVVVGGGRDEADALGGAARVGNQLGHLITRELSALARFGALRHLDLYLVRIGQVLGGDAKAAGGHLLDGRAPAVGEAARVLAPLARVGLAAERVHRERERLVRLRGDGSEAHRAGAEALDNLGGALDLQKEKSKKRVATTPFPHMWRPHFSHMSRKKGALHLLERHREHVVAEGEQTADGHLGEG